MTSRNDIFRALLRIGANAAWTSNGGPTGFKTVTRKWKDFSQFGEGGFPVLIQIEPVDTFVQKTRMEYKRTFDVRWLVYFKVDVQDDTDVGAEKCADIMDAIESAMIDQLSPDGNQTLGGLVEHAFLSDSAIKVSGDDTGNGMIGASITILVP